MLARRLAQFNWGEYHYLTCALWANYSQRAYNMLRMHFSNALSERSGMFAAICTDCFCATMRKRCLSLERRVWASPNAVLGHDSRKAGFPLYPAVVISMPAMVPGISAITKEINFVLILLYYRLRNC